MRTWEHIRAIPPTRVNNDGGGWNGKETHHETVGYRTREMDRLHLLRKSTNERIDGEASKTCDAHTQCNPCGYTKPMQVHRWKWRRVVVSKRAAGSAGCSQENWRPLTGEPWKGAHCAAPRQRKAPLLQLIVAVLVHCRERITAGLGEVEHASRTTVVHFFRECSHG